MARARKVDQLALDEVVVDNEEAETALERRLAAKDRLADVRGDYEAADEAARNLIGPLLPEGTEAVIRIGRFRITRSTTKPRSVAFETKGSTRVRIGLAEDEE